MADKFPPLHGKAIAGIWLDPSLVVEDIAEALFAGKDDSHWIWLSHGIVIAV